MKIDASTRPPSYRRPDCYDLNGNDYSVNIDVDEQPTGDFQIGVTFGTIEGATLITELNEKNIAGTGRDLSFVVNTSENNSKYKFLKVAT